MEIGYSNFGIDHNIYGEFQLNGLVDRSGSFIYDNFYDVKIMTYKKKLIAGLYIDYYPLKTNQLVKDLISELEINEKMLQKKMEDLSTGELIKILVIKALSSPCKFILLDHIDTYLSHRDLKNLMKTIRTFLPKVQKDIIFSTSNIDNIIENCDKYIIAENSKIIYKGKDLDTLPEKSSIIKFVDAANKKKANLIYYKDANDLLKAIYRSVKK